ncbi:transcriptional regulator [Maribellus comscasis]|uniref:Transcriptional regulator n=1 Tax=Maribellus comscasis TaxID=2681766 RepID=A0A6I6K3K1_9BACT|nr:helix-turn-helix domain-containing protein [Maribellus comscasis]QGY48048.1 transcriptional regulator [Maribellus comscasis]
MEKELGIFSGYETCPVRNVLDRFGDKWSVLVLLALGGVEKMRFNELYKTIGSISQKMLTSTLRVLEADGLVSRTIYPEIPPRVEYKLTERGKSLLVYIHGLVGWAKENMEAIKESREQFDRR